MKIKSLFIVLMLFSAFVINVKAQYSVSGKVFTSPDGMVQVGLQNVRVYSTSPYVAEAYTDASGNYVFENVPAASLMTIYAEKNGYSFLPAFYERMVSQNYSNLNFTATVSSGGSSSAVPVTFMYQAKGTNPQNVFLAGSMNNYAGANENYRLTSVGGGLFSITLNLEPDIYYYKFVEDGSWENDPFNPSTDGGQYNNSLITVSDPMITYFLPAFNESYSTTNPPLIKIYTATTSNSITLSNYTLKINSTLVSGTPSLSNKVLSYTPSVSELQNGTNTCEVSFTVSGHTISKTIQFQYSATTSTGFSVSGNVSNAIDKSPLSGVVVSCSQGSATTDASGNYTITGIKDAVITLTATKANYNFAPFEINLTMNKNYTDQNFWGTYSEGGTNSSFNYSISGKVTACGNPLEGIGVESRGQTVYTNASGEYTVTGTIEFNGTFYSPTQVDLKFTDDEYIISVGGSDTRSFSSSSLKVNPVVTGENIFAIKAFDFIEGTITYPDGSPAFGIPLKVYDEKTELLVTTITTDEEGKYSYPIMYAFFHEFYNAYKVVPESAIYRFNPSEYIMIENTQTCDNLKNKNFHAILDPTPICMVSVSETGKNIVVWEKPDIDVVSGFKVYRESNVANVYDLLGTVPYANTAVFEDANSDPTTKAYRYKIGTITTFNGIETELSPEHKTIHLTINKGIGNSWNLIWSHYEGLDVSTYKLYRGTTRDNVTFLTDIAGTLNSFTDNNPPTQDVYYQIEMVLSDACNPEVAKPISTRMNARNVNNYSSTKSNVVSSLGTGIDETQENKIIIYPNPVEDVLYLAINEIVSYEIYSLQGSLVVQGTTNSKIDVSALKSGLYQLRCKNNNLWLAYKFMKK